MCLPYSAALPFMSNQWLPTDTMLYYASPLLHLSHPSGHQECVMRERWWVSALATVVNVCPTLKGRVPIRYLCLWCV